MDGLNKKFIEDPESFLREHVIQYHPRLSAGQSQKHANTLPAGVHDFNLTRDGAQKGAVLLRPWSERGGRREWFSNKIKAYWLPWEINKTMTIDLASRVAEEAEIFFTSQLDGCRFEIGQGRTPVVAHIPAKCAGGPDLFGSLTPLQANARKWRDAESNRLFGAQGLRRRFSQSTDYNVSRIANIVGKKFVAGWRFWAQGVDMKETEVNRKMTVEWRVGALVEHEQEGVIELTHDRKKARRAW